ncbi:3-carboxy-cis,cis-muconate cycloisomerase [Rugosimonospora acidiphila]|uniref:3-carboxy-cis,cis-muconate cycloisomerase n=1 Tax=Rugosimonospora acidiphila TaxID=556531 RepID=UPI0031EA71A0
MFDPLFGTPEVDRELDGRAWVRAMLDFERALARAQSRAGLVPPGAADAIAEATAVLRPDPADLGRRARASGTPVVPLLGDLGRVLPAEAAPYLHLGATSQDVLDTAAVLVTKRCLGQILADLNGVAEHCARLAAEHRDTLMAGRTLGQHALPITFGLTCAGWLVAVGEGIAALERVREHRLAVQFGGAAGTLAALGADGPRVLGLLAAELGLAEPVLPWHTDRTRIAELAGALGAASGVLATIALDLTLLAQTELGEIAEATGGASSAMPHKQNPVRSVLVTAATRRVPGLVATLLSGMAQEHQRAAGAWHAEWQPLSELLGLVGGATAGTADVLSGLRVDARRMRQNLDATRGLPMAERVAGLLAPALGRDAAHELVSRVCRDAVATDRSLGQALHDDPEVRAHLSPEQIDESVRPGGYLGSTSAFIDRALAAHANRGGGR